MDDEKLLKIGLGLGRGDLRVEGNFQMGWHRRCRKRYRRSGRSGREGEPLIPLEEPPEAPETTSDIGE